MTPNFPYLPLQGRRIKGYDLLSDALFPKVDVETEDSDEALLKPKSLIPEFILFLGDFIYADVPFWAGPTAEDYRRLYRRNYASLSFRKIYERIRACLFHSPSSGLNCY